MRLMNPMNQVALDCNGGEIEGYMNILTKGIGCVSLLCAIYLFYHSFFKKKVAFNDTFVTTITGCATFIFSILCFI